VERLAPWLVAGELSLDGALRPVRGVLSLAMCAKEIGLRGVIVPRDNAAEAQLVQGIQVVACESLEDAARFVRGKGDDRVRDPVAVTDAFRDVSYAFDLHDGDEAAHRPLEMVVDRLGMSARTCDRILKVARTLAELEATDAIDSRHVAEAVQYRRGIEAQR
jgi:predicted ATPase with chaperone activity